MNFIVIAFFQLVVNTQYPWLVRYDSSDAIVNRIKIPPNYKRIQTVAGSFEYWLQYLPLKKGNPPVYLFDGGRKIPQNVHVAVVNIDVGNEDLQQCADAIIRLRAEYLYSNGDLNAIHFNFTCGDTAKFIRWKDGWRPIVSGNRVRWSKASPKDSSYENFRRYLDTVFRYAGSYSLSKELYSIKDITEIKIGDIFIKGGFPGHAVIVVDIAIQNGTGKKIFLLAQSYMPAQDIHILKNPTDSRLSPWYSVDFGDTLYTPEWPFSKNSLKRFE